MVYFFDVEVHKLLKLYIITLCSRKIHLFSKTEYCYGATSVLSSWFWADTLPWSTSISGYPSPLMAPRGWRWCGIEVYQFLLVRKLVSAPHYTFTIHHPQKQIAHSVPPPRRGRGMHDAACEIWRAKPAICELIRSNIRVHGPSYLAEAIGDRDNFPQQHSTCFAAAIIAT